jgi:hypothetical protein
MARGYSDFFGRCGESAATIQMWKNRNFQKTFWTISRQRAAKCGMELHSKVGNLVSGAAQK